jgi:hypothetical protein
MKPLYQRHHRTPLKGISNTSLRRDWAGIVSIRPQHGAQASGASILDVDPSPAPLNKARASFTPLVSYIYLSARFCLAFIQNSDAMRFRAALPLIIFCLTCSLSCQREVLPRGLPADSCPHGRGRYLVEGVTMCFGCHSDLDWTVAGGPPTKYLIGAGHRYADEGAPWAASGLHSPGHEVCQPT